ncbi:multiheme c-type cytochrome [Novosphingobium sp. G106]|uniref:multiheme c-type cytochrome n=1 Tax=Novosphingobium sp. G106 TaxID=2849500 RepID=UPI002810F886|nr:multiheme c-type cytochrome [Novosphingobium sp. G106]
MMRTAAAQGVRTGRLVWARLFIVLALLLTGGSMAVAGGLYQGVASCAGSTCHGRSEGDGKVVRQDELMHWQEPSSKGGAHSRAYAALGSARGQKIAASLGLGNANSASACLGCHATNAGPGERGPRFQLSDGVGCESCHGAASGWLSTHYAVPATHVSNIAQGMIPLDNPKARASVCLDCHFGSGKPGQFVTHGMMAAGHPRVAFELDLFSDLQRHWDEDADYRQRKGGGDSGAALGGRPGRSSPALARPFRPAAARDRRPVPAVLLLRLP